MAAWTPDPAGLGQILQTLRDSTNIHDKQIQQQITMVSIHNLPLNGFIDQPLLTTVGLDSDSTNTKESPTTLPIWPIFFLQ